MFRHKLSLSNEWGKFLKMCRFLPETYSELCLIENVKGSLWDLLGRLLPFLCSLTSGTRRRLFASSSRRIYVASSRSHRHDFLDIDITNVSTRRDIQLCVPLVNRFFLLFSISSYLFLFNSSKNTFPRCSVVDPKRSSRIAFGSRSDNLFQLIG